MKRTLFVVLLITISSMVVYAQPARVVAPPSTLLNTPGMVHTHLFVYIPEGGANPAIPNGETPASVACIYGVVPPTSGCPKSGSLISTGGAKAIAVVEYGGYPTVQSDFDAYNAQWGLPSQTLISVCYPGPTCPNNSGSGWDLETALDVQIAHALAPNAQIYIAEFTSDPLGDNAEQNIAALMASTYGAGEVSNSWTYNDGEAWCGSGNCELGYDSEFAQPGIVYFAAAGDAGAQVNYPCISPNVNCAGGTHVNRDGNGNFLGTEACWSGSGGGISLYEPLPDYQRIIRPATLKRGIPDLSAVADPATGVAVYNTPYCHGWCVVGGTSVASPLLAAYVNNAGNFRNNSVAQLGDEYKWYGLSLNSYKTYYRDITTGSNGHAAVTGWDQCTGLGSPIKPSGF
ncbi:MAG: S53 family peptidase [Candidatus Korobacteraceae bacterium]